MDQALIVEPAQKWKHVPSGVVVRVHSLICDGAKRWARMVKVSPGGIIYTDDNPESLMQITESDQPTNPNDWEFMT